MLKSALNKTVRDIQFNMESYKYVYIVKQIVIAKQNDIKVIIFFIREMDVK